MTTKKYETVLIEKQDGITWLIMNRPDKRNAMSPQLHLDMDDALAELDLACEDSCAAIRVDAQPGIEHVIAAEAARQVRLLGERKLRREGE